MTDARRCTATNRDGSPCSATPQPDRETCVWHDPDRADERRRSKREGGRSKSNATRAKKKVLDAALELGDIDTALCKALSDVLEGTLEPNVSTAAASIARTISAVRAATEHEQRISELEKQFGTARGQIP